MQNVNFFYIFVLDVSVVLGWVCVVPESEGKETEAIARILEGNSEEIASAQFQIMLSMETVTTARKQQPTSFGHFLL